MRSLARAYERLSGWLPGRLARWMQTAVSITRRRAVLVAAVLLPRQRRANRLELLLFVWDVDEGGLEKAVASIATSGVDPGRALVVTNCDSFGPLRSAGCPFEFVPPAEDAGRLGSDFDREGMLEMRVAGLLRSYSFKRLATAGPPGELEAALSKVPADAGPLIPF